MNTASMRKLVRLLGMLGSEHSGERAAAALSAHRLVTRHGTWWALLNQKEAPGKVVEVHSTHMTSTSVRLQKRGLGKFA